MSESRDSRWMLIEGFPGAVIVRDLMRDAMRRLDDLDRNGASLAIPDLSITTAKLATSAVTVLKLAADAVSTPKIVNLAVTTAKLANGVLEASATGLAKMADGFLSADAAGRAKMADDFITTAKIGDDQVTKAKLAGGFLGSVGIAGGAAGNHTVTGITTGDELKLVYNVSTTTDLTAEFSITGADTINNAAGTDTTGEALLVFWLDLTT